MGQSVTPVGVESRLSYRHRHGSRNSPRHAVFRTRCVSPGAQLGMHVITHGLTASCFGQMLSHSAIAGRSPTSHVGSRARRRRWVTALLLDTATLEYPGFKIEYGAEAVRAGSLQGTLFGCPEGGYELVTPPRCELRPHRGESIVLWWSGHEVQAIVRVELDGDRITRLRNYCHAPELITEVCRELEVPFRTHGYQPASPVS
jgi:hypothetical protein